MAKLFSYTSFTFILIVTLILFYFTTFALKQSIKACDDILNFHQRFESRHPFQAGNGRVGRLVMFKECLANSIVPFIITEEQFVGLLSWKWAPV